MKKLLPLLPPLVLALTMITACEKAPAPAPDTTTSEQEIERRVQERVAQERQADQARALDEKNAALQKKEQDLADREAALQKERDTQADSEPDSSTASNQDTNDAPPVVSSGAFYDSLAPYGQWLQIPGQSGYVWQPSVGRQDPNWRPYQIGRWAYTDQGWSWVSDEPFGWATYHYGRWTRLREAGWVWVPGDEWAPAWVSWRSSDDYVGWAPLPPDAGFGSSTVITYDGGYSGGGGGNFCFVPYARFCEPAVAAYIVAAQYNTTIINKTVNITNIVRTGNHSSVVINNAGPKPAIVQQKTGREVRPLQIRPQRGGGKSQISGNTLTVGVPAEPKGGPRQPGNVRPLPRPADPRSVGGAQQPDRRTSLPAAGAAPSLNAPAETEMQRLQRVAREREQQLRAQGGLPAANVPPAQNVPQTVIRNGDQIQPLERDQIQPLERGQRQRTEAERQQAQALRQQQQQQQRQPQANPQTAPNQVPQVAPAQNPALQQQQAAQRALQLQQQQVQQQAARQLQQQQAAQQQAARAQRQAERAAQPQQAPAQQQQPQQQPQRERPQPPAQAPARVAPPAQSQPAAPEAGDGKGKGQDARDKGR